jgi:L-Ala-D/L-Glu epimerase
VDDFIRGSKESKAMNRRELLKIAGAAGMAPALRWRPLGASPDHPGSSQGSGVDVQIKRLNLRHTWTTTMSSSAYRDTVNLRYTRDGMTGYGEGAPIIRYKEFPAEAKKAIEENVGYVAAGNPKQFDSFLADIRKRLGEHQRAAMAAVDIAVMDWVSNRLNVPV